VFLFAKRDTYVSQRATYAIDAVTYSRSLFFLVNVRGSLLHLFLDLLLLLLHLLRLLAQVRGGRRLALRAPRSLFLGAVSRGLASSFLAVLLGVPLGCTNAKLRVQTEMQQAGKHGRMHGEAPLLDHAVEQTDSLERGLSGKVGTEDRDEGGQTKFGSLQSHQYTAPA
jgi:hypothetical protein